MKKLTLPFLYIIAILFTILRSITSRSVPLGDGGLYLIKRVIYLQPGGMVFEALLDLMELQKGVEVINDQSTGILHFVTMLYGAKWKIKFNIAEIDHSRCAVAIEASAEGESVEMDGYAEIMERRERALLDSMLLIGTPYEPIYLEG